MYRFLSSAIIVMSSLATVAHAGGGGAGSEGDEVQSFINTSPLISVTKSVKNPKIVSIKLKSGISPGRKVTVITNTPQCDAMGNSNNESDPNACVIYTDLPKQSFVEVKVQYTDTVLDDNFDGSVWDSKTITTTVDLDPSLFAHNNLSADLVKQDHPYTHDEPIYRNGDDGSDEPVGFVPVVIGHHTVTDHNYFLAIQPK